MLLKAQSAIEYLMTYGWMLLVVAIVGGAIFSVFGGQSIESVTGFSGGSVQVSDFGLTGDSLQFSVRNGGAEKVKIEKIIINDSSTGVRREIKSLKSLEVGDSDVVELKGVEGSDSSESHDVEVVYSAGGLSNLTVSGTVTGSFNVFNHVDLTDASFNRSKNELSIGVVNTGSSSADSISYTVSSNDSDFSGSLSGLDLGESSSFSISTDETFPLESVNLEVGGSDFVNSNSGIQCTPTKGLVGYWSFNDEQTEESYALDLSGYGNNASLEGGVTTGVEGRVGESYEFDGGNDYLQVSDSNSIDIGDNLTLSASVVLNSDTHHYNIISRENSAYRWRVHRNYSNWFLLNNDTDERDVNIGSERVPLDSWFDYSVNYNVDKGKINWFIDGQVNESMNSNVKNIKDSDVPLRIGSYTENSEFWNGRIDEVRIYNRSLSLNEIQRLSEVRSEDWAVSGCRLSG